MSAILDRGSLLFASAAVLGATLLLKFTAPGLPISFFTPLLVLAVVYVPGTLLLATLLGRLGGMGVVFQRDYSPLLTCAAMAFAAAEIPLALGASLVPAGYLLIAAVLYFALLMFLAVRTVFGVENGIAAGVVALSWIPLAVVAFFWGPLRFLLGMLASPFFLFFAWYYLGSELSGLGAGLRSRQSFRRMLEAAAVNPHDGEAQYQLGLIHQQRHQYTEAAARFQKAIAIDPTLTDAHFQLGRMAPETGRPRARPLPDRGRPGREAQFQRNAARTRRHLRRGAPVRRCAQRIGDLYRAPALRSGRTLLLRPVARRARRDRRGPRRLCSCRRGRPHRAALSPAVYRPLEPAGPEATRQVGGGVSTVHFRKPLPIRAATVRERLHLFSKTRPTPPISS